MKLYFSASFYKGQNKVIICELVKGTVKGGWILTG